jgi:hypothetical protein
MTAERVFTAVGVVHPHRIEVREQGDRLSLAAL